jgi:hypothetical protein
MVPDGRTITVDGRLVLTGDISGKVTSSRSKAVGDVTVEALDLQNRVVTTAAVAGDGSYVLRYLPAGSYIVHFVPGPGNALQPIYWEKAKTFDRADRLTVTAGQTHAKVNVELKP